MKQIILIVFTVIVFIHGGQCQTYSINDFTEISYPKKYSKEWHALNNALIAIAVKFEGGKLQLSRAAYSSKSNYKVPQGMLLGDDEGEWGGGLYFQPKDTTRRVFYVNGKADTIKNNIIVRRPVFTGTPLNRLIRNLLLIKRGNIKTIFKYKNEIYFMEGLAHMSTNEGTISKISFKKDSIAVKKIIDLDNSPETINVSGDVIYLVTFNRFYVFNNWQKGIVFDDAIWYSMYPNSIAVKSRNEVYIGMRAGYAMVDPIKKEVHFYKYNK